MSGNLQQAAENAIPRPIRVLVVEDERIVAMSLRKQLHAFGYEVVGPVSNGEAAIQSAGKESPDLVLMDVHLDGEMDGIQTANTIRERYDLPIIYLTAYSTKTILDRAKVTEPFGYILKPYEDRELHVAIETGIVKHRSAQKLQASERRFRTTLNGIGDAIIAIDRQERVTFLNPSAERITKWKQADAIGQRFDVVFPLFTGKGRTPVQNFAQAALDNDVIRGLEPNCLLLNKDGRELLVDINAAPITADGELTGVVFAFRDVTDQRRVEASHQQSQKLESLGLIAGSIAHGFNNLLTPILSCATMLGERVSGDTKAVQMAEAIKTAGTAAARLTRQMLTFAGEGHLDLAPLDLSSLVRAMAGRLSSCVSEKVELTYDLQNDLPEIEGDASEIGRIVLNLIANASESIGDDSGVIQIQTRTVDARREDLASRFVPETPPAGKYVVLQVADTGSGIAEETLGRIFDPFFTTKFIGRGLGLASVLGVVRNHRGTIHVRSTPNEGTTFEAYFPEAGHRSA